MKNLRKMIEYIVAGVIILGIGLMVYWLFRPYELLTSEGDTIPLQEEVEVGGVIDFQGKTYCNKGVDVKVTRLVANDVGGIYLLPLEFYAPKEVFCAESKFTVELPKDVPPGTWTLVIRHQYQPNPTFRTITLETRSLPFKVIGEGKADEGQY
jgi:hypothetical protein